jgi:cellulose synthase/poly-beta-1,6-N-acetylglucosamine synthase-like glycosyltransferase
MILDRALVWYDYLHEWLSGINDFLLVLIGLAFSAQLIFIIFFFVKKTVFPKAKKKHKFGILICARNEADVIGNTVKEILTKQNYPKDLYDVYVVADNCTDNTAELAKKAGATVFKRKDDDPSHHKLSYALKYGFQEILKLNKGYECFIRFDADNIPDANFIDVMNDAFESGVECARCLENSSNINQNNITKCMGLYYLRDCRLTSRVRERFHLDCMANGPGMMISANIIKRIDGWDAMGASEDCEFSINRMFEGVRVHFVEDAIVYEDQASTMKDTFNRLVRIGHGMNLLFWKKGFKMLLKLLTTFRISFLDLFLQMFFIPMAFLCCTWIPLFYAFDIVYAAVLAPNAPNIEYLTILIQVICYALIFLFYLMFVLQALMVTLLERNRIKDYKLKNYIGVWFIFPFFMIYDCITIFFGVVTRPKWKAIKRNKV